MIILLVIIFVIAVVTFIFINRNNEVESNLNNNQTNDNQLEQSSSDEQDNIIDNNTQSNTGDTNMEEFDNKINININGTNYTATLEDNESTRKLYESLPLTITMNELNGNEKYYYMDSSLPTSSKNVKSIQVGDIMLYGSDCLVVFYESFNTSYSYTKLGRIDNPSNLKNTVGNGNINVSITK